MMNTSCELVTAKMVKERELAHLLGCLEYLLH